MPINEVLVTIQPYFIGAVFGVIGTFAAGFSQEFFAERARKARHKLDVAIQVHKICNEAITGSFENAPQDMKHINFALTDLEGVDQKMSVKMTEMVSSWRTFAREFANGAYDPDEIKVLQGEFDRAEENRKTLVAWATKIRTGN
jgi:hypothetical protein